MSLTVDFQATLWLWSNGISPASRHFITIPQEVSDQIRIATADTPRKGRGSVRVEVRIGYVKRQTSIFPESKTGCYLLPVKKAVRTELGVSEGDEVHVVINLC